MKIDPSPRCPKIYDTAFALVQCKLLAGHVTSHYWADGYAIILWINRDTHVSKATPDNDEEQAEKYRQRCDLDMDYCPGCGLPLPRGIEVCEECRNL